MIRSLLVLVVILVPCVGHAQDPLDPTVPPQAMATATTIYPLYPPGMRVVVGAQGALARNTPSLNGTCGPDNHTCTQADALLPNTYGVVQPDPPVLDAAGWYWLRIQYATGVVGWSSAYPPFINALTPPQMVIGSAFQIVGDYLGPVLTGARCILDGVNSDAIRNLQPDPLGQRGTLHCPVPMAVLGNHIAVQQAINSEGTASSAEFQYAVTEAPQPPVPSAPSNLRIAPTSGAAIQLAPFDPSKFKPIPQPK